MDPAPTLWSEYFDVLSMDVSTDVRHVVIMQSQMLDYGKFYSYFGVIVFQN